MVLVEEVLIIQMLLLRHMAKVETGHMAVVAVEEVMKQQIQSLVGVTAELTEVVVGAMVEHRVEAVAAVVR